MVSVSPATDVLGNLVAVGVRLPREAVDRLDEGGEPSVDQTGGKLFDVSVKPAASLLLAAVACIFSRNHA
jgi:hypothetical protein